MKKHFKDFFNNLTRRHTMSAYHSDEAHLLEIKEYLKENAYDKLEIIASSHSLMLTRKCKCSSVIDFFTSSLKKRYHISKANEDTILIIHQRLLVPDMCWAMALTIQSCTDDVIVLEIRKEY